MELEETVVAYDRILTGLSNQVMGEGSHLRFKNTEGEGNFLDVTVPDGKTWDVTVVVRILESDAE